MNTLGKLTKNTFLIVQNEKVSLEFTASAAIKPGQPVKLTAAGKVAAWAKTDALSLLIGYAYNEASGDGKLITVFTRGYILMVCMSSGDLDAGPCTWSSYDSSTAGNDDINMEQDGLTGYNVVEAAGSNTAMGWLLDNTAALGDICRVLMAD